MQIEHSKNNGAHRYECWDDYGCSIVGSAVVIEQEDHVYLKDINVSSYYRGRGIGTRLLNRVIVDFKKKPIMADVFEARLPWYRRHGFKSVGRTDNLIKIIRPS
ncbi:MAG: hypothetical protein DRN83_03155 [Hadesarchaea archaeon]|nr:MAG: hypothetical protein DRN83_03155 [Hadesarchaea archaeon]HDI12981.1 N-acetyltransferase [Hadesarchaea archaeon]